MKIFGFEFSSQEAREFADWLSDKIYGQRNELCTFLRFCNDFVNDWFNEINSKFTSMMDKKSLKDLPDEERKEIKQFMRQYVYQEVAFTLGFHLRKLSVRWEETGRFSSTINSPQDMEMIKGISKVLTNYETFALEKAKWWAKANYGENWDIDTKEVTDWISNLAKDVAEVNRLKNELIDNLGCKQGNIMQIVRDYRKKIGKTT